MCDYDALLEYSGSEILDTSQMAEHYHQTAKLSRHRALVAETLWNLEISSGLVRVKQNHFGLTDVD